MEGARRYEDVIASHRTDATSSEWLPPHAPGGDDLVFIYTGGTTGAPKAVMWRSGDLALALWQMARPGTEPPEARLTIERGRAAATVLPACPLMHGTGLFIALSTLSGGGTVVLIDTPRLDAAAVWSAIERESVRVLTIVGDAFARPLLEALDREPDRWNLARPVGDHVVGRHVEPGDQAGAARAPPGHHAHRSRSARPKGS